MNAGRERRSDYAALAIILKQRGTGRILSARHNPGIGIMPPSEHCEPPRWAEIMLSPRLCGVDEAADGLRGVASQIDCT
jgi:hypothetical protein